jgi:hypothetical protein
MALTSDRAVEPECWSRCRWPAPTRSTWSPTTAPPWPGGASPVTGATSPPGGAARRIALPQEIIEQNHFSGETMTNPAKPTRAVAAAEPDAAVWRWARRCDRGDTRPGGA